MDSSFGIKIPKSRKAGEEARGKIVQYIVEYHREHGYAPTFREIQDDIGISSLSLVHFHLDHLRMMGHVSFLPGSARTLLVTRSGMLEYVTGLRSNP